MSTIFLLCFHYLFILRLGICCENRYISKHTMLEGIYLFITLKWIYLTKSLKGLKKFEAVTDYRSTNWIVTLFVFLNERFVVWVFWIKSLFHSNVVSKYNWSSFNYIRYCNLDLFTSSVHWFAHTLHDPTSVLIPPH